MSKREIRKLETIIGKLESLQCFVKEPGDVRDYLAEAKSRLISALNAAERNR